MAVPRHTTTTTNTNATPARCDNHGNGATRTPQVEVVGYAAARAVRNIKQVKQGVSWLHPGSGLHLHTRKSSANARVCVIGLHQSCAFRSQNLLTSEVVSLVSDAASATGVFSDVRCVMNGMMAVALACSLCCDETNKTSSKRALSPRAPQCVCRWHPLGSPAAPRRPRRHAGSPRLADSLSGPCRVRRGGS